MVRGLLVLGAILVLLCSCGERGITILEHPILPRAVVDSDYYETGNPSEDKVALGKLLFYDKILSGNNNISCATCHAPNHGTGDGLSVSIGEGGLGLGPDRVPGDTMTGIQRRVSRNAPPIFNLGAREFTGMFHDGRLEVDSSESNGFSNPLGDTLPMGIDNVLAAQAFFPVANLNEMSGQAGENAIADQVNMRNFPEAWELIADKVRAIPEYAARFLDVFGVLAADITYNHIADAIAAYEVVEWRADNSPFDHYLRGDEGALSPAAKRGMNLFYGAAKCSSCHSGTFQTDHGFHAIAMPQIGPGANNGPSNHEDFGREKVTALMEDRYKFHTPSLRNVEATGPWGHAGAYNSLEAVVRHHLDPVGGLLNYDRTQAVLPFRSDLSAIDFLVMDDAMLVQAIANANELAPNYLGNQEIADIIEFLKSLTDPDSLNFLPKAPTSVPSGLPVFSD